MMISESQKTFIKILKDYIHNDHHEYSTADWDEVFHTAFHHSMDALIYYQCSKSIPKEFRRKYLKPYIANALTSVEYEKVLTEFVNHLNETGLSIICMKGSVFRDYYPHPALRSMGDIDLVIKQEDKELIDQILMNHMGFSKFINNHAVWTYLKKKICIEVHNHMFYEELTSDFDYIGYFDHIFEHIHHDKVFDIESDYLYVPDENYHFLYLMTHTAKHIINNGSGFRAYLDMVMFTRNNEKLDWEWIREELKKMNLLQFTETCFALCERWFDVKMPLPHKELDESFFEEITEKTFNDGVFGLDNKDNEGAHTAKEIKRENRGYWLTSIRLMTHLLFPPYENMILAPWYSFLKGKRWLLPFAWIYRWIYCIIHKFRFALSRLTEPFRIKEKIKKRKDYINTWGL